jgi:hypothetical protein
MHPQDAYSFAPVDWVAWKVIVDGFCVCAAPPETHGLTGMSWELLNLYFSQGFVSGQLRSSMGGNLATGRRLSATSSIDWASRKVVSRISIDWDSRKVANRILINWAGSFLTRPRRRTRSGTIAIIRGNIRGELSHEENIQANQTDEPVKALFILIVILPYKLDHNCLLSRL